MMKRRLNILFAIMNLIIWGSVVGGVFLLFDPRVPTEFLDEKMRLTKTEFKRGESVELLITANKNYPIPVSTSWRIRCDGLSYPMPGFKGSADLGKNITLRPSVWIPYYVQPGECFIELHAEYRINILKMISFDLESEPFTVTNERFDESDELLLPEEAYIWNARKSLFALK